MRKQVEGESVDTFITALYTLAEHCSFGDLKDESIRDRIVDGVRDARVAEKVQMDAGFETQFKWKHQSQSQDQNVYSV